MIPGPSDALKCNIKDTLRDLNYLFRILRNKQQRCLLDHVTASLCALASLLYDITLPSAIQSQKNKVQYLRAVLT